MAADADADMGRKGAGQRRTPLEMAVLAIRQAGAGIEPTNSGFADRCLTTWLPRRRSRMAEYERRECVSMQAPELLFAVEVIQCLGA